VIILRALRNSEMTKLVFIIIRQI